ncbi:MAG: hypothetical protein PWQ86_1340 [Bacillota bacterium]|jgi:hypothetical protein|nr:hypothetical protein [Bacillota bacterium]
MNPGFLNDLPNTTITSFLFLLLALSAVLLLLVVVLWLRLSALTRRYNAFMTGNNAASLEGLLEETLSRAREQSEALRDLRFALRQLETMQKRTVQRIGIVRFNAFPDTGSDLSFAVAILDGHGDGVVLSSLYGREESRVYAKPVRGGRSTYHLTQEEEKAIAQALAR